MHDQKDQGDRRASQDHAQKHRHKIFSERIKFGDPGIGPSSTPQKRRSAQSEHKEYVCSAAREDSAFTKRFKAFISFLSFN